MKGYSQQLISPRYKEITDKQEKENDKEIRQQKRNSGLERTVFSVKEVKKQTDSTMQEATTY